VETDARALAPGSGAVLAHAQAHHPALLVYLHLSSRKAFRVGVDLLQALVAASSGPVLLAGGAFASDHAREILDSAGIFDAIIAGEVEETLVAVARAIGERRPWWQEPGLWHRRNGLVERTSPRSPIEDLDTLPRAATDFLQPGEQTRRQVLVSRGCNSNCSYCTMQVPEQEAFPLRQRFWRSRSPRIVVDEIEHLWRHHGIERFAFHSFVLFGYDQAGTQTVEGIARELLSRELPIRFSFVTHPGHLRRNLHLVPLLRQAGLESLFLGIDSILDRARCLYRLPFDREDVWASLAALRDGRIQFQTGYIFYDPYTTLEEIDENLSFLRTARPMYRHLGTPYGLLLHHQVINTFLTLSPRMPIVERLRSDGLLIREGNLESPPVARFLDREAGRFAHLHRRFNQDVLRRVAPIVFHPALEEHFSHLAFFLIDALETLRLRIAAHPEAADDEVLHDLASWSRETLAPAQEICGDSSVLPAERQKLASTFFQEGKELSCATSCTNFDAR
jgi:radical SAM superfamily enzyme YgiQ (UPF0313 family)